MDYVLHWNEKMKENHKRAAKLLEEIKDRAFDYIRNHGECDECEVQEFIVEEFKKNGLISDKDPPIVAFHGNTGEVHYFAKKEDSKKLGKEGLILIDIWAKLPGENGVYADITWMEYKGKEIPEEINRAFGLVIKARDECLRFIKDELKKGKIPSGNEADKIVRNLFEKEGVLENFKHSTGHSLGEEVHGIYPYLNTRSLIPNLLENMGYTIEPGLYFEKDFGVRSEMNFYINEKMELVLTTELQKEIVRI